MNSRINKIVPNIRYLDDSNQLSENTSGIYDSDETTSDIEIANATINVGDIYSLYNFGGFKYLESENNVVWNAYFIYRSSSKEQKPALYIISYIIINMFLRNLEQNKYEVNCTLNNYVSLILQYRCNVNLEKIGVNYNKIKNIEIKENFEINEETLNVLDDSEYSYSSSSSAKESMKNIMNSTNDMEYLLDEKKNIIILENGNLNLDKSKSKFYINKMTLSSSKDNNKIQGNYNFYFNKEIKRNAVNQTLYCKLLKNNYEDNYNLECSTPTDFNQDLNLKEGFGNDEDNKDSTIILQFDKYHDSYVDMRNSKSLFFYNKHSSGLSGGAIAGIIIICIVTLIIISLMIILLRKRGFNSAVDDTAATPIPMNSNVEE